MTVHEFDEDGELVNEFTNPDADGAGGDYRQTFRYDALGRLVEITDAPPRPLPDEPHVTG